MARLEGKVALITGAASGMGAACSPLRRRGAKVIITDINEEAGSALSNELGEKGIRVNSIHPGGDPDAHG